MSFDPTAPAISQTYGDAISSTRANLNDLNNQIATHEADTTAHGLGALTPIIADYNTNHKNSTTAHGIPAIVANVTTVTNEVSGARGSADTLASRLGVALNVDGTLKLSGMASKYISNGDTPTYVSATAFAVAGDRSSVYLPGAVLRFTLTSGYVYAPVVSRSFSGGVTTVTLDSAYTVLDGTVSVVEIALIAFDAAVTASLASVQAALTVLQSAVTTVLGFAAASAEPPTGIPPGAWALVKNTSSGVLKLWANDGGTLKSITLN